MKRRPHWTDDLIEAVKDAISSWCFDHVEGPLYDDDVYPVIAAVEDWHEKFVMHGAFRVLAERAASAEADRDRLANQLLNEVPDSYIQMKARALTAEATIQRVRDVCDLWQRRHDSSIRHPADIPAVAIVAVLRALDGDGDA